MKGVIIIGSARKDGNTAKVVDLLKDQTGFDVVNLLDYSIHYYTYNHYHLDDDFVPLMDHLTKKYDLFIFATPVYWYTMSAPMKTFFDRLSDLVRVKKEIGQRLNGKKMAVISCGSGSQPIKCFNVPFQLSADYLKMEYVGDCFTWCEESTDLEEEVKNRILNFSNRLIAH